MICFTIQIRYLELVEGYKGKYKLADSLHNCSLTIITSGKLLDVSTSQNLFFSLGR